MRIRGTSHGVLAAIAGLLSAVATPGCNDNAPPGAVSNVVREPAGSISLSPEKSEVPAETEPALRFTDVTEDSGIHFVYYGNPSPEHYMTEQNGGGTALADFDGDGWTDVFLVNGSNFDRPAERAGATNRLYRATGPFRFEDATSASGLGTSGFGMGCATGDWDNDGFIDLFVTGYGQNRLWRNQGDGTFGEVELEPRPAANRWSTSAAFADLDGDGNLDLYVVNYVDYSRDDAPCFTQHQPPVRISCGPLGRKGQPDLLYHNLGDGRFRDVSADSGIASAAGKGLGLCIADFDGDGRLDIYVANDTTPNLLWHNQGGMRFEDVALIQGVAVGSDGVARSGMGVAAADYNNDGRLDLVVTNFENEPNDLYENRGADGFLSRNTEMGLDADSRPMLGFGVIFTDFDLDGFADLFVANGHVWDLTPANLGYSYAMPPHVFRNVAGGRFVNSSRHAGAYFQNAWLGRGTAVGDLDRDGDWDVVVTHLLAPATILRNDSTRPNRAIRVRLIGSQSSRTPLGTSLQVEQQGRTAQLRTISGDGFQSASETTILVPVVEGPSIGSCTIRVRWSNGISESVTLGLDAKEATIIEGRSIP